MKREFNEINIGKTTYLNDFKKKKVFTNLNGFPVHNIVGYLMIEFKFLLILIDRKQVLAIGRFSIIASNAK